VEITFNSLKYKINSQNLWTRLCMSRTFFQPSHIFDIPSKCEMIFQFSFVISNALLNMWHGCFGS